MCDGLENSGLPLGGLGTGSVELRGDGCFHEWQIINNRPWGSGSPIEPGPDASHFGLNVRGERFNRSVILSRVSALDASLNNPFDLARVERPTGIKASTRMPFTQLDYDLRSFPVAVTLNAFSPFIPLDAKNSALPLAYFTFHLENRTSESVEISLFNACRNLVGYTQPEAPSVMEYFEEGRSSGILFGREGLSEHDSSRGSMVIGSFGEGNLFSTYLLHPISIRDIWDPLHESGRLENRDEGDFGGAVEFCIGGEGGRLGLPFGVLCRTCRLEPEESCTVVFSLTWHFPEMYELDFEPKGEKARRIGHQYENWFQDAREVFEYGIEHYRDLRARTKTFFDTYYESSFDSWLLEAVSAQLTTLIKSSWWDRQGRFGIWEGLGCCGLQTTDITHYGSFPIVLLFPELQKSQMRLTVDNQEYSGKIPHSMPGSFSCCDIDNRNRIDMIPQFVLLIWRDVLWTGDRAYAAEMWPVIKDALSYYRRFDRDGDGLPNNTGPDQTYDQFPLKGTSAFVGFLYTGMLKAVVDLAELMGDEEYAADTEKKLAEALKLLDRQLWNGRYYHLCHDPEDDENNEGVMADQVNGDWFIRQTTGNGLLPNDRITSALSAIVEHCSMKAGFLANCAWPFGGNVEIGRHTADQAHMPWSGVEYALAAHLILVGMEEEAISVARNVWERYEQAGLRFNHIECGEHYYRPMSAWAIYLALTGFTLNMIEKSLSLSLREADATFIINTPTCWALVKTSPAGDVLELSLHSGELVLRKIILRNALLYEGEASINGRVVEAEIRREDKDTLIQLKMPVKLLSGDCLRIYGR